MNFNNTRTFSENLIHNMRLSLIPLRRLRMNGNNVGIWVEVFFIPWLNLPAPPTSAISHFWPESQVALEILKLNYNFVQIIYYKKLGPKLSHYSLKFQKIWLNCAEYFSPVCPWNSTAFKGFNMYSNAVIVQ